MSLRKFLLIPLLISLIIFGYFSSEVRASLDTLLDTLNITSRLVTALAVAVLFQIAGHVTQAYKARLLLSPIKESSARFQFRALSVGYLFNTILPFKLGELIRARIISGAMSISFSYAFTLIIFERAVDALLLGVVGLVLAFGVMGNAYPGLVGFAIILLLIATLILTLVFLLIRQNRRLIGGMHWFTRQLNDNLKVSYRFKAWSIIYGLQRTLRPKLLVGYFGLSVVSWVLYALSIWAVVGYFFPDFSASSKSVLTAAPYFGQSMPAGPASLGVFSDITNAFTSYVGLTASQVVSFNLVTWAVLVLPMAAIGLVLLLAKTRETLWRTLPKNASRQALINKLYRSEDISSEMANFLENFFAGNSLSKIVHKLELRDNFRLIKYFKGGSDAITILAVQDGKEIVKKIIPIEFRDRLRAQYLWLEGRKGRNDIVKVLGEEDSKDYYAIDIEFDPENEMFYDYIHKNPMQDSMRVLDNVWADLSKELYANLSEESVRKEDVQQYVDKHIFGCLEKAAAVDAELIRAAEPKQIYINGKAYHNLYQVMDKIRKHPQAWNDIAKYRESELVHGDVIVDNLLVSKRTGKVLIIDPAPDGNVINGPVFDFGKNLQSLYCGYEALLRDEDAVLLTDGNRIDYRDSRSEKYVQLADYVMNELAPKYLTESERKAMLFHAAALYIRRLKHQVYYTPENTLKFYAVGVRTLNEFLKQYG